MHRRLWIMGVLLATIALDQLTKMAAKEWLRGTPTQTYWGDFFRLQYTENKGAFLSVGATMPESVRYWFFTVAVGVVLVAALGYLLFGKMDRWQSWGMALVIAGGVGNLIDRALYGRVIDFMNMGIGWLRTGIFNVADMAIMAGVGILFLLPWLSVEAKPR